MTKRRTGFARGCGRVGSEEPVEPAELKARVEVGDGGVGAEVYVPGVRAARSREWVHGPTIRRMGDDFRRDSST